MTDFNHVIERFKPFFPLEANLIFTAEQKEMMTDILGFEMDDEELKKVHTCFFNFENLDAQYVQSIWAYGLMNCTIETKIEAKSVMPFAALNASGKSLDYGSDVFAETNNWGVLCFDLENGSALDCPVVWVYEGDVYRWSSSSRALTVVS